MCRFDPSLGGDKKNFERSRIDFNMIEYFVALVINLF